MNPLIRIKDGETLIIYDDEVLSLMKSLGKPVIERATHVEFDNEKGKWIATVASIQDYVPFPLGHLIAVTDTRKEAIDAELAFLKENLGKRLTDVKIST